MLSLFSYRLFLPRVLCWEFYRSTKEINEWRISGSDKDAVNVDNPEDPINKKDNKTIDVIEVKSDKIDKRT